MKQKGDKCTSKDIQNKMIKVMALQILRKVAVEIRNADFFNIMVDEATDVANISQFTLCIRWVDDNLDCHEYFIELHSLEVANEDTIVESIKDVILWMTEKLSGTMLWWLFNIEGRKVGCSKVNKIRGTEGIAYSLLYTFIVFSSWWCHQGH